MQRNTKKGKNARKKAASKSSAIPLNTSSPLTQQIKIELDINLKQCEEYIELTVKAMDNLKETVIIPAQEAIRTINATANEKNDSDILAIEWATIIQELSKDLISAYPSFESALDRLIREITNLKNEPQPPSDSAIQKVNSAIASVQKNLNDDLNNSKLESIHFAQRQLKAYMFLSACNNGSLEKAKEIYETCVSADEKKIALTIIDTKRNNAIHAALYLENFTLLEWLTAEYLSHNLSLDQLDKRKLTFMLQNIKLDSISGRNNNLKIFEWLIKQYTALKLPFDLQLCEKMDKHKLAALVKYANSKDQKEDTESLEVFYLTKLQTPVNPLTEALVRKMRARLKDTKKRHGLLTILEQIKNPVEAKITSESIPVENKKPMKKTAQPPTLDQQIKAFEILLRNRIKNLTVLMKKAEEIKKDETVSVITNSAAELIKTLSTSQDPSAKAAVKFAMKINSLMKSVDNTPVSFHKIIEELKVDINNLKASNNGNGVKKMQSGLDKLGSEISLELGSYDSLFERLDALNKKMEINLQKIGPKEQPAQTETFVTASNPTSEQQVQPPTKTTERTSLNPLAKPFVPKIKSVETPDDCTLPMPAVTLVSATLAEVRKDLERRLNKIALKKPIDIDKDIDKEKLRNSTQTLKKMTKPESKKGFHWVFFQIPTSKPAKLEGVNEEIVLSSKTRTYF